jgi:hypothetical protein
MAWILFLSFLPLHRSHCLDAAEKMEERKLSIFSVVHCRLTGSGLEFYLEFYEGISGHRTIQFT